MISGKSSDQAVGGLRLRGYMRSFSKIMALDSE